MTVLYSVTAGNTILAADLNQYKSMLEGASGYTSTYKLRATSGSDFVIVLGDNNAANKFSLHDSDDVEVWKIDSNGGMTAGALSPTSLIVPNSGAPAQTASGSIVWDTVNERITIGNGTSRREFSYDNYVYKYKSATQVITTTTTFADVTAASGNFAFPVVASGVYQAEFYIPLNFGGTGGAKFQLTGPAAPTTVDITGAYVRSSVTMAVGGLTDKFADVTAFSTAINAQNSGAQASSDVVYISTAPGSAITIRALIINGANAGTVTLQAAQNSSNSTTTLGIGSWMKAYRIA